MHMRRDRGKGTRDKGQAGSRGLILVIAQKRLTVRYPFNNATVLISLQLIPKADEYFITKAYESSNYKN
jgi:hypothetical protein